MGQPLFCPFTTTGKNLRDASAAHAVVPIIHTLNEGRQRFRMPATVAAAFFTGLHITCLLPRATLDADLRQPGDWGTTAGEPFPNKPAVLSLGFLGAPRAAVVVAAGDRDDGLF